MVKEIKDPTAGRGDSELSGIRLDELGQRQRGTMPVDQILLNLDRRAKLAAGKNSSVSFPVPKEDLKLLRREAQRARTSLAELMREILEPALAAIRKSERQLTPGDRAA